MSAWLAVTPTHRPELETLSADVDEDWRVIRRRRQEGARIGRALEHLRVRSSRLQTLERGRGAGFRSTQIPSVDRHRYRV